MAAQTSPLSLDDFHKLYDGAKPACEYWHGAVVQKSMPTALHGVVQAIILLLLKSAGWTAASEVRLKIVSDVEPVPDVIAVRGKLKGPYPTTAPELCIEIMSPKDTLLKALEKARTYLSWGTQVIWIIDPDKRLRGPSHRKRLKNLSGYLPAPACESVIPLLACRSFSLKSIKASNLPKTSVRELPC